MAGTLKDLNESGLGQTVDQHAFLQDGTQLAISGVMAYANQIIVYYSLRNPNGIDEQHLSPP